MKRTDVIYNTIEHKVIICDDKSLQAISRVNRKIVNIKHEKFVKAGITITYISNDETVTKYNTNNIKCNVITIES